MRIGHDSVPSQASFAAFRNPSLSIWGLRKSPLHHTMWWQLCVGVNGPMHQRPERLFLLVLLLLSLLL